MSQIDLSSDFQHPFTSGTPMIKILNDFIQALLNNPDSSLTGAERQIIANYISNLNDWEIAENTIAEQDTTSICDKLKALLKIAAKVQQNGNTVTDCDIETARWQGASNTDIHDTILIAAAFGMYNRYVDNMATAIIT